MMETKLLSAVGGGSREIMGRAVEGFVINDSLEVFSDSAMKGLHKRNRQIGRRRQRSL